MSNTRAVRLLPQKISLICLPLLLAAVTLPAAQEATSSRRHLVIVVDGLRPDYITPDVMPTLTALGKRGVVFTRHHSVYPTVTRVNASSIATGSYPDTHGLLGNTVFFPKLDVAKFFDTADFTNLQKITPAEGGRVLTTPTLAEQLQSAGRRLLVAGSGSSGAAFLNNPMVAGGAILHPQFTLPASLGEAMKVLGPPPTEKTVESGIDHYAVDALLKVGLPQIQPTVTVLWLSDLDTAAHTHGVGAPPTVAVLRRVDGEIKRIEDGLRAANLFDSYDIWVTSDHGFSSYTGAPDVAALLKPFAKGMPDGSPRIVSSGGAIYVRDGDVATVAGIVTALQRTPGVGAIFTRAAKSGSLDGQLPGTLSFDAIHWQHDRSAQILISPDWTDNGGPFGLRGTTASNGVAGHGSSSPWDIHNTLMAAGPDLKSGVTIDAPSANVDFAPTFLKLLGLPIPSSMQGRPLEEAFVDGKSLPASAIREMEHTAATGDEQYVVTGKFVTVNAGGREYRYFDGTRVGRK
jgi:arylsulfatase A-like enzyme